MNIGCQITQIFHFITVIVSVVSEMTSCTKQLAVIKVHLILLIFSRKPERASPSWHQVKVAWCNKTCLCVCFRLQQMFERPSESWRKLRPSCRWTSWSAGREFWGASDSPVLLTSSRWKGGSPVKLAGRDGWSTHTNKLYEYRYNLAAFSIFEADNV